MNRIIEISLAAIGAVVGLIAWGSMTAAAIGAVAGFVVGALGSHKVRQAGGGPSIIITGAQRREMESAVQMGIAAMWAIRPVYRKIHWDDAEMQRSIFEMLVEPYCGTVTPYLQHLRSHMDDVARSGIRPDAAMAHVRRRYAPRFMRRDVNTIFSIAMAAVHVQTRYGPIQESYDWFARWCEQVGIGANAAAIWKDQMGDAPLVPMAEWYKEHMRAHYEAHPDEE